MGKRNPNMHRTKDLPNSPVVPPTVTGVTPPNNLTNEQTPATDVDSNSAQNPVEATEVPAAVERGASEGRNEIDVTSNSEPTNDVQGTPTSTPVVETSTPVDEADALVAQNENHFAPDSDPTNGQTVVHENTDQPNDDQGTPTGAPVAQNKTDVDSNSAQNRVEATEEPAAVGPEASTATSGTSDNNPTNGPTPVIEVRQVAPNEIDVASGSDPTNGQTLVHETPGQTNEAQERTPAAHPAVETGAQVAGTATSGTSDNNPTNGPTPVIEVRQAAPTATGGASDSDPANGPTPVIEVRQAAPIVELNPIQNLAKQTHEKIDKGFFLNFVLTVFCFHWRHNEKLTALKKIFEPKTDRKNDDGKETEQQALEKALNIHRFPFFSCCRKEPRSFADNKKFLEEMSTQPQ